MEFPVRVMSAKQPYVIAIGVPNRHLQIQPYRATLYLLSARIAAVAAAPVLVATVGAAALADFAVADNNKQF